MKRNVIIAAALILAGVSAWAQPKSFGEPKMLIKSSQNLMAPVWSPDGSKIAVTGDNFIGIFVANADGTQLQQVSGELGAGYKMSWNDAQNITSTPYTLVNDRRMTRIEQVNTLTGERTEVANAERNFKRSKAMKSAPSVLQIMVDDPDNATARIPALNAYKGKMVINPALSPDGSKIAFQIVSQGVWVCNADGTNPVSLGKGSYASWLPDNENIMVSRIKDNGEIFTSSDIYCVNTKTASAMNITPNSELIPITIAVSPDGSKVAFDNDTDGCIYVVDLKY